MEKKLLVNSLKSNKLVTVLTVIFMAMSAMLIGLCVLLFSSLTCSIDRLMSQAQTPDFLQMHTGKLDETELFNFSEKNSAVQKYQLLEFLNCKNSDLSIAGQSMSNNNQDNGLCVQSQSFDYLLGIDSKVIFPEPGEVYVPVCYRDEYQVKIGDEFEVADYKLTVAGFLRDSQMNSMLASSKRFLVSEQDFKKLEKYGAVEYLIEFKLHADADIDSFSTEYANAKLPQNGPTITYSLIKLMNALSDGLVIILLLLVGIVVVIIALICIRNILLTSLSQDRQEIGLQKALGISTREIKNQYLFKYFVLSVFGAVLGELVAIVAAIPLRKQIDELYGLPEDIWKAYVFSALLVLAVEAIIFCYINRTLLVVKKYSTIELFHKNADDKKMKSGFVSILVIVAVVVALICIPQNISSTLSSPGFVTNMGIGDSQIRIDIRQNEATKSTTGKIEADLKKDKRIEQFAVMQTRLIPAKLVKGDTYNLLVESGDHSIFPVKYSEGTYPKNSNEIALSRLNCDELGLKLGDTMEIDCRTCRVCGIYSDITNGGKTAKACFYAPDEINEKACCNMNTPKAPIMWSIIYLNTTDPNQIDDVVDTYLKRYGKLDSGIKVTDIKSYVNSIYGPTIMQVKKISVLVMLSGALVILVVVLLFTRLIVWQDRNICFTKKALGITGTEIIFGYLKKMFLLIFVGLLSGILFGVVPGEKITGAMLSILGASEFSFEINYLKIFVVIPTFIFIVAIIAALIALKEIKSIKPYECCINQE